MINHICVKANKKITHSTAVVKICWAEKSQMAT